MTPRLRVAAAKLLKSFSLFNCSSLIKLSSALSSWPSACSEKARPDYTLGARSSRDSSWDLLSPYSSTKNLHLSNYSTAFSFIPSSWYAFPTEYEICASSLKFLSFVQNSYALSSDCILSGVTSPLT